MAKTVRLRSASCLTSSEFWAGNKKLTNVPFSFINVASCLFSAWFISGARTLSTTSAANACETGTNQIKTKGTY